MMKGKYKLYFPFFFCLSEKNVNVSLHFFKLNERNGFSKIVKCVKCKEIVAGKQNSDTALILYRSYLKCADAKAQGLIGLNGEIPMPAEI